MTVDLEPIHPTETQIVELYDLLSRRKHTISHQMIPSFGDHRKFVEQYSYRAWYLVKIDEMSVGSVYVQTDNSVGLNNLEELDASVIKIIIDLVRERVEPMAPIASVRYKEFFFNVSVSNTELMEKLGKIGYEPSQVTYIPASK